MLGKLDFLLAELAAELTMLCASLTHWRLSAGTVTVLSTASLCNTFFTDHFLLILPLIL